MHYTKVLSLNFRSETQLEITAEIREKLSKPQNTDLVILITGPIPNDRIAVQLMKIRVRGLFSQAVHLEYQK